MYPQTYMHDAIQCRNRFGFESKTHRSHDDNMEKYQFDFILRKKYGKVWNGEIS